MFDDLSRGKKGICHGRDGADVRRAEEGENEFRRVGEEDHDGVAVAEAEEAQAGRDFSGNALDVVVCVDLLGGAVDQTRFVSILGNIFEAIGMQGKVFGNVYIGEFRSENDVIILFICSFHFFGWYQLDCVD